MSYIQFDSCQILKSKAISYNLDCCKVPKTAEKNVKTIFPYNKSDRAKHAFAYFANMAAEILPSIAEPPPSEAILYFVRPWQFKILLTAVKERKQFLLLYSRNNNSNYKDTSDKSKPVQSGITCK